MTESLFNRIIGWLQAGYPDGVPASDYVPLMEVLRRRLTPGEVDRIAQHLADTEVVDVTADQIRAVTQKLVLERPSDEDVQRVASHLALGGWPLTPADFGDAPEGWQSQFPKA